MKTVYSAIYTPAKIIITDEREAEIEEAKSAVREMAERRDWWGSIDVIIPDTIDRTVGDASEIPPYTARVSRTGNPPLIEDAEGEPINDPNAEPISGDPEKGYIKSELGIVEASKLETIGALEDIGRLPAVWFDIYFIDTLLDEPDPETAGEISRILDAEHVPAYITEVRKAATDRLEDRIEVWQDQRPYLEAVVGTCTNILEGRATLEDFLTLHRQTREGIYEDDQIGMSHNGPERY